MNPELQKQLAEMLSKLMSAAGDATGWAKGQIPSLVQEKIIFGRFAETTDLILCFLCVYALWRAARFCHERLDDGDWFVGLTASLIGLVVFAFIVSEQLQRTLMVFLAPRLYVIEWLHSMVAK